jgi:hypothetical protein
LGEDGKMRDVASSITDEKISAAMLESLDAPRCHGNLQTEPLFRFVTVY